MATIPELHEPQIAAARARAWHQASEIAPRLAQSDPGAEVPASVSADAGDLQDGSAVPDESTPEPRQTAAEPSPALLTLEAARAFIEEYGLVLFAPRPLGAPAPTLVEATLGRAKANPTPAEASTARSLVARLTAEGSAVPLNLLGGPGDVPDFVVAASALPFVFTLRGDKGWKRPPETSGAVKVTPLALRVYELLDERGGMTVAAMVPEIGREITESAVLRALNELWAMLRVLPGLQQGEGETVWELTTTRFLKAVKAGANAGQPTALSALISLYLGQVFLATEEEIASFLSPLTARSRVRDVLHGLTAGRQLDEAVLEGKNVLYVPDSLPDFAGFAAQRENLDLHAGEAKDREETRPVATGEGERIRRFGGGSGNPPRRSNVAGKPASRERSGSREGGSRARREGSDAARGSASGARPARGGGNRPSTPRPRRDGADERRPPREGTERRPRTERPPYARPWDEERGSRPPRERSGGDRAASERGSDARRPPRRDDDRGGKPTFRREQTGERPPFRREGAGARPFKPRRDGGSAERPPRREGGAGARSASRPRSLPPELHESGHAGRGERAPSAGERRERSGAGPRGREERGSFQRSDRPGGSWPRSDRPRREGDAGGDRPRGARPPAGARDNFARPRPSARFDRPRGQRDTGEGGGRPGGPVREFGRGPQGRPPARAGAGGASRGFSDRPSRGGAPMRGRADARPPGKFAPRPGSRTGPGGGKDRGGFSPGPKRGGTAKGGASERPARRPRPEDEA